MLLHNLGIIGSDGLQDIFIEQEKIKNVSTAGTCESINKNDFSLSFKNAIAFPGLINSHDHLDFNLFPRLGKIYNNYREWGIDINKNNKTEIDHVLHIPQHLRVQWGIYKNLLHGITTVVNHGRELTIEKEIINVFQDCYSLHSAAFEEKWKWKLNHPFADNIPFVMHAGEGTDEISNLEIDSIIKWNLFKRKLIAVHGVAMNKEQAKFFDALIWCPASNYFLLDKTANVDQLKNETEIVFGTDSTLTASWNLWDHLRLARNENGVTDQELFNMLTAFPASVWHFENRGKIAVGNNADIVIANAKNNTENIENFFALNPEDLLLIIHNGNIRMFDESLYVSLSANYSINNFSRIISNGKIKYVEGDLPGLMNEIKKYHPGAQFPVSCW
jgi:cytosine/adenosine deaminase-related metal-dependent hydrolase